MVIQWYPGHMAKTRKQIKEDLKLIDIVIELLDARIPIASRNPDIEEITKGKKKIVILNKCDLADRAKLDKWIKYYKDRGIKAIPVDTLKGVGLNKLVDECRNAVKDKMDALKEKGRKRDSWVPSLSLVTRSTHSSISLFHFKILQLVRAKNRPIRQLFVQFLVELNSHRYASMECLLGPQFPYKGHGEEKDPL